MGIGRLLSENMSAPSPTRANEQMMIARIRELNTRVAQKTGELLSYLSTAKSPDSIYPLFGVTEESLGMTINEFNQQKTSIVTNLQNKLGNDYVVSIRFDGAIEIAMKNPNYGKKL